MKKRMLSLLLALLLVCATACGGSGNGNDKQGSGNNDKTPSGDNQNQGGDNQDQSGDNNDAPTEPEYTIQWYCPTNSIENGNTQKIIERFEDAYPQYKVQVIESDADATQKLTMIAAGETIDTFYSDSFDVIRGGEAGTFVPLNEFYEKDGEDFIDLYGEAAYQAASKDGVIYGIPHYYNTFKVIYNKTMTDSLGITIPQNWSWEEFKETVAQLKQEGVWGCVWATTWSDTVMALAQVNGWYPVVADADGNVTPNFDDPILERSMSALKDLSDVDGLIPSVPTMRAESLSRRAEFVNQRTAMFVDGPFSFIWMKNYMFDDPGDGPLPFEVATTNLPYFTDINNGDGKNCMFIDVPGLTGIPNTSGDPYVAYKFARFLEEDPVCNALNSGYLSCFTKWEEKGTTYDQMNEDVFNYHLDIFGEEHRDFYTPEMIHDLCNLPLPSSDVYYNIDPNLKPAYTQAQQVYGELFDTYFTGEMNFDDWAKNINELCTERLAATNTNKIGG